jgi:transposase
MGTDLSDAQWERIHPLLPVAKPTGRPRADDRRTINGILYVLRTGSAGRTCRTGTVVQDLLAPARPGEDLEGFPYFYGRSRKAGLEPSLSGWQLQAKTPWQPPR